VSHQHAHLILQPATKLNSSWIQLKSASAFQKQNLMHFMIMDLTNNANHLKTMKKTAVAKMTIQKTLCKSLAISKSCTHQASTTAKQGKHSMRKPVPASGMNSALHNPVITTLVQCPRLETR